MQNDRPALQRTQLECGVARAAPWLCEPTCPSWVVYLCLQLFNRLERGKRTPLMRCVAVQFCSMFLETLGTALSKHHVRLV